MIAMFPVPAWIAKLLSGVQKKKMKAVGFAHAKCLPLVLTILFRPMPASKTSLKVSFHSSLNNTRLTLAAAVMSVLRMIKLFGWEARVRDEVAKKREEELKYIWKRKILGLLNNITKYVLATPR